MSALAVLDSAGELTVLAWRRTLLRWVVIAVVGARVFFDALGPAVVVVAFVTIVAAAVINLAVSREYSQVRTGSGLPTPKLPDALQTPTVRLGILVVGTLVLGIAALAWVLVG